MLHGSVRAASTSIASAASTSSSWPGRIVCRAMTWSWAMSTVLPDTRQAEDVNTPLWVVHPRPGGAANLDAAAVRMRGELGRLPGHSGLAAGAGALGRLHQRTQH